MLSHKIRYFLDPTARMNYSLTTEWRKVLLAGPIFRFCHDLRVSETYPKSKGSSSWDFYLSNGGKLVGEPFIFSWGSAWVLSWWQNFPWFSVSSTTWCHIHHWQLASPLEEVMSPPSNFSMWRIQHLLRSDPLLPIQLPSLCASVICSLPLSGMRVLWPCLGFACASSPPANPYLLCSPIQFLLAPQNPNRICFSSILIFIMLLVPKTLLLFIVDIHSTSIHLFLQ